MLPGAPTRSGRIGPITSGSVLARNTLINAHLYGQDWRGWEPPRHLQLFNVDTMWVALKRSGFTPVRVRAIARGAREILASSAGLKRKPIAAGNAIARDTHPISLGPLALQIAERSLAILSRRAGEEILAIAGKGTCA